MGSNYVGEPSRFVAHRKENVNATDHPSEIRRDVYPHCELSRLDSPGELPVSKSRTTTKSCRSQAGPGPEQTGSQPVHLGGNPADDSQGRCKVHATVPVS